MSGSSVAFLHEVVFFIDLVLWPVQREDCGEFQKKKYSTKPRKSQALTWVLGTNTFSLDFMANIRDFYTVAFGWGGKLVEYPRLLIISPRSLDGNF